MSDEPTAPEFHLPDWGTEGAPPEPAVSDEREIEQIEISVERPMLLTAGPLPARWDVKTVHGLVISHAKGDKDEHSVKDATAKAIADLRGRAEEMGANAVTHLSLTVSGRKSQVVVTAWGTAVSFSR